jgi:hypothetical protein
MARSREAAAEAAQEKRLRAAGKVVDGGLVEGVSRAGGELLGFSVKLSPYDVLITLRAEFPGGRMVGFIGGETLSGALVKAQREAASDAIKWREDRWAGK